MGSPVNRNWKKGNMTEIKSEQQLRLERIERDITEIKSEIQRLTPIVPIPYRTAQVCPVCYGKGIVCGGFYNSIGTYTSSTNMCEPCRTCGGSGVVYVNS